MYISWTRVLSINQQRKPSDRKKKTDEMVHVQTKSYEAVDIANTCKYGVNIPEWSAVIFAIRTGACRMFNHTSPTIQEFRPINNISTLPVPSLHPTLPKKKTLKTTRPVPPNWKKNRSNINLAVKVFTHPHSSFLNSYIFSHLVWNCMDWFNSHGWKPTNLPKLDPPIPSVTKSFPRDLGF